MDRQPPLRIILVGKTGSGKSSTGNFILRNRDKFKAKWSLKSVTKTVSSRSAHLGPDKTRITVVDTPGLFDKDTPMLETALNIQESVNRVRPGPHAFLFVINTDRLTNEQEQTMIMLQMMFGKKVFQHTILIFTNEDRLPKDGSTPENIIRELIEDTFVKELLEECSDRFITLNTREKREIKVEAKLKQILRLANDVSDNGKIYYNENIEVYKSPIAKYAEIWTSECLTGAKLKEILYEQEKEIKRVESEEHDKKLRFVFEVAACVTVGALVPIIVPAVGSAAAAVVKGVSLVGPPAAAIVTKLAAETVKNTALRGLLI